MRLTLAHELGHAVMHCKLPNPEMEAQAYQFAAEFLMPEKYIRQELNNINIEKLATLKPYWKVSMSALLMRAGGLGTITPRTKRYLWAQMSKAGFRTREPIDIAFEEPALLNEIIDVHLKKLGYGLNEISKLINLNPDDVQNFYNILPTNEEVKAKLRLTTNND